MITIDQSLDEQVQLLLSSYEPLERWLTDECGPVAGHTSSPRTCPLACFLHSRLHTPHPPTVFPDVIEVYGPQRLPIMVATPTWVNMFVRLIDWGPGAEGRILGESVPRERALAVLTTITRNTLR
jgi:hypothetical protein